MNPISFLADLMRQAVGFFYGLYPNYGVAIILLTVTMKLVLYPLTRQSLVQMAAMQKLQPRIKEIQKEYKDDPKELQKKTMEIYQEEKVNPLGGCLPILLQFPFMIGLFFAIRDMTFEGPGAGFLWISDLAKPDIALVNILGLPISALVILIGLTTYLTQKATPQPAQQGGNAMMMAMPLFIAFISANFPAGVQIYWVVHTAITAAQQAYILRRINKGGESNGLSKNERQERGGRGGGGDSGSGDQQERS